MRVLVIPDVHLKPWMFERAAELMRLVKPDKAVCLMDIPDDWNQEFNLGLYEKTFKSALEFQKAFPDTLWSYGNHDRCYVWDYRESGHSPMAAQTVNEGLRKLQEALPEIDQMTYIHRIDNVLFLHGGLSDFFVTFNTPKKDYNDVDAVIGHINGLGPRALWSDESPLWLRPQYNGDRMYKPRKLLQVVGHTPVKQIQKDGNVITCDVFSTYRDGTPIGTQEYLLIDTETWEYSGIK